VQLNASAQTCSPEQIRWSERIGTDVEPKGTDPLNERFHDEFVRLSALFHTGEITEEEWALLQIHLAYCPSCQATFEQFEKISSGVFPAMAVHAAGEARDVPLESQAALDDAEARLMAALQPVTVPAEVEQTTKRSPRSTFAFGALAACVAVLVAFACVRVYRGHGGKNVSQASTSSHAPEPPIVGPAVKTDGAVASDDKRQIAELKEQLAAAGNRSSSLDSSKAVLARQMSAEQAQRDQLTAEKEALSKQLADAESQIQSLRDAATSSQGVADKQAAQLVALETNVRSLTVALEDAKGTLNDRDRMLALDKDFLAHDRDIRDLIGARNLYIADIFDTTETGKTAKPFGRIFYTQDRSLVFYGFDLDKQAGLKQSVAFQAWGTGSDRQPVSLGLFYQDDAHKRWVVRCNDEKTLARMNMVFVTVEPPGGSNKPTGKQMLRAYLQIQPNHP
jgi:hypothetical protein